MSEEDVQVRLSAQGTEDIINAFRKVQRASSDAKKQVTTDSEAIGVGFSLMSRQIQSLTVALGGLTVGAAIVGLTRLGKEVLNSAAEMERLHETTGISVKTLSLFNYTAERNGRTTEQLSASLRFFAKNMGDLEVGGTKASSAIRLLFGSARALDGLNQDQKFNKIAIALGTMTDSSLRAKIAQDLFGRAGAANIPTFVELANAAGELEARGRAAGKVFDGDLAEAAQTAQRSFTELAGLIKGGLTEALAGASPTINGISQAVDVLNQALGDSGSAFHDLGEAIGFIVKGLAGTLIIVLAGVATEITTIAGMTLEAEDAFKGLSEITIAFFEFDPKRGAEALKKAISDITIDSQVTAAAIQKIANARDEALDRLFNPQSTKPKTAPGPDTGNLLGGNRSFAGTSDKAAAEAELAALEDRRKDEVANEKLLNEQLKEAYDQGKTNLQDYFDQRGKALSDALRSEQGYYTARIEIQKRINAAEIATIAAKRKDQDADTPQGREEALKTQAEIDAAKIRGQAKIASLEADRRRLETSYDEKAKALDDERFKAQQHQAEALSELRKRLAKADGDAYKAEIAAADEEIAKERIKTGLPEDDPQIQQLRDLLYGNADIHKASNAFEQTTKELQLKREEIALEVQAGTIFPAAGEARDRSITQEYLKKLKTEIDAMELLGVTAPQDVERLAQMKIAYAQLSISTNTAALAMAEFKKGAQEAVTSDIINFFDAAIDGAKSFGEAVKNMAVSIVKDLAKIAIQIEITALIKKMFAFFGGGGGGASFFGGPLDKAADGGYLAGPSHALGGVPIEAEGGEYIVNRRATAANLGLLNALNFGSHVPNFSRRTPRFADGGMVDGAAMGGGSSTTLAVFNDPAQFTRFLKSPEGQKAIVHVVSENPTQIRRIINS